MMQRLQEKEVKLVNQLDKITRAIQALERNPDIAAVVEGMEVY